MTAQSTLVQALGLPELVRLCAVDSALYCKTFFPGTFRQPSPLFHKDIFSLLEDPHYRHVAIKVFRGGAKTTLLRAYASKRIAYGTSRTIMLVGLSQDHAKYSLGWLKNQVDRNRAWTQVFGIERGRKWTDEVVEIYLRTLGHTATVIAVGITGQTRGINVDDYRPDLIVIDDPCNEENAATPEQRGKTAELVFGALDKSLAPVSEAPDAKMALLGTPLNGEDIVEQCVADPEWASRVYGCFGEDGQSAWSERFPTEELRKDKAAHIEKGQQYLLLWLREMECQVVGGASARFKLGWLKFWDVLPEMPMAVTMGIDPAPPPSDRQLMKGLQGKDCEVLSVVGATKGDLLLLDYSESQGMTPEWTTAEFFRLLDRWRPIKVRIEGIAYQRTLKWILEKAMKERGRYVQVDAVSDRRSKELRIDQALSGPASQGRFFVNRAHTSFLEQFGAFPQYKRDDLLDATAMAVEAVGSEGYYGASLVEAQQEALPESFGRWAP